MFCCEEAVKLARHLGSSRGEWSTTCALASE
jgi:hypothetical protein